MKFIRPAFIVLIFICLTFICLISPVKIYPQDSTRTLTRDLTWAAAQLLPFPVWLHDAEENNGRIITALRWQVIPVNISFHSNKYTSPVQFFYINPVRKFTGSAEIFIQPELALASFKYAKMGRWGISSGLRLTFPIKQKGEHLSWSVGGKYTYRKDEAGNNNGYWGAEAGIYAIFNFLGLQFNYNFDKRSRYNFGIYYKYF